MAARHLRKAAFSDKPAGGEPGVWEKSLRRGGLPFNCGVGPVCSTRNKAAHAVVQAGVQTLLNPAHCAAARANPTTRTVLPGFRGTLHCKMPISLKDCFQVDRGTGGKRRAAMDRFQTQLMEMGK